MGSDATNPLLVDLYEMTMVDAYRREGMDRDIASFSLFVRTLPPERGYLVAAGLDDVLTWLEALRFGPDELAALHRLGTFGDDFLGWLGDLRFTGNVRAVPEGTLVFAEEPILEVDAPIAEAQLAETFLLNQITLQTTLATKAARCRDAADGRAVVDFALRRTHGTDAGMKLARVARLVGLAGTSNVAGADRYGVAASGTMAHSFVQAHPSELGAFSAFIQAYGATTVLLVDTYDTHRGVDRAIEAAAEARERGVEIRAVRLDSGDLAALATHTRKRLDDAGFPDVAIFASGGLDEYRIERLVRDDAAPIDGFGVGTAMGASADAPTLDSVYKLVEHGGRPVRKTSEGKRTWPGRKQVWRSPGWGGDVLALAGEPAPGPDHEPLLVEVMRDGRRTDAGRTDVADANGRFEHQFPTVPAGIRRLADGVPHPLSVSPGLAALAAELDRTEEV